MPAQKPLKPAGAARTTTTTIVGNLHRPNKYPIIKVARSIGCYSYIQNLGPSYMSIAITAAASFMSPSGPVVVMVVDEVMVLVCVVDVVGIGTAKEYVMS